MKLSKRSVMLMLVVCAAILAVATATEAATSGSTPPFLRNRRALLGAQWGPASYRAGGYGRNWGYGGYYGGFMRYPNLPDPVRMDTSTERRFAMIS